jgi:hypothetical protein
MRVGLGVGVARVEFVVLTTAIVGNCWLVVLVIGCCFLL